MYHVLDIELLTGSRQFTRDDVSRISSSTLNAVLEKLNIRQIVEGIAVFPAGEGVYLVDLVMRDLTAQSTWGVTVTIPPPKEATTERDDVSPEK